MKREAKPLTGRGVLIIAVCAFSAIIGANLTLAFAAIDSFPGVEVRNGYIASQSFERDRAAQKRLGWRTEAHYERGVLTVEVLDRADRPAPIEDISFRLGRPTTEAADFTADMKLTASGWVTDLDLAPGLWRLDVKGGHRGAPAFRQHLVFEVGE